MINQYFHCWHSVSFVQLSGSILGASYYRRWMVPQSGWPHCSMEIRRSSSHAKAFAAMGASATDEAMDNIFD